ncbi:HAD-IIIC family phosphatase [Amycolatopsis aidingensis]|uniref:HAD-IIIC family phosphatase n=1 Tax=Amycolatopsis aidingensis TaxID=2842453 RepID=UPI001C0E61BB|nr:HAD-IIIC family phosphatase [Amycolatopsis aidingensis]
MNSATKAGIAVAGTFTLTVVTTSMAAVLDETAPGRPVITAPYGQVLETLHDPGSVLMTNVGVNVLLLRPEDFARGSGHRERADAMVDELVAVLADVPDHSVATWFLAIAPSSPATEGDVALARWVRWVGERLTAVAEATPGMYPITLDRVAELYEVAEVHDEYADRIGHLPYTDEYCEAVGTWLVRQAVSSWVKPKKVVVLDCDNTLWTGICGEDDPVGVQVTESRRWLQEFMLAQRSSGKLLCLCSRNNQEDVEEVFTRNSGMVLLWDHISGHRIGWNPKAQSLVELANELDLALGSFIFVDDDAVECASVRAQLPEVTVVELARAEDRIRQQIEHTWAFDQLAVTEDDRLRADWYSTRADRAALRETSTNYQDFLDRCAIEVNFADLTDDGLDRAAQLTARTTQFNLAGAVYSVPQLRALLAGEGRGWTVRVRDRFGDYGTVGLVVAEQRGDAVELPVFLLSCRVLNRRVEDEVLRFVAAHAARLGAVTLRLPLRPTGRNAPARLFVEQLTGVFPASNDNPSTVAVPVREWVPQLAQR